MSVDTDTIHLKRDYWIDSMHQALVPILISLSII